MELSLGNTLLTGDPRLVDHIVGEVKSQGIFDQFRKECIADVDTKPAYQNLRTRVESSVNSFLGKQTWKADLNKNQLRETLRKHIVEAPYLDAGVERIVDQVVNPKVYSVFMPQIEDVVYKFLGLERPRNRQRNGGPCGFKDLLPKDLDPVSPESDKNSLKDISLDSVDAHVQNPDPREKKTSTPSIEQSRKDDADNNSNERDIIGRNGDADIEEKSMDDPAKSSAAVNLNSSVKSDDKTEEEEEDSPTFEPIDIMNLNESNISNDSHLSGISELTSHRSRSPDFSNDASRDNMDFSNQDSQFSKVSSDSRLSIVTDFGSSNHASTPIPDAVKDNEKIESKCSKDNFKAVREFESGKGNKDGKSSYESERSKENTPSDLKPIRRSLSSKETSRDGMESSTKDSQRNDSKSRKNDPKDCKKEREKDNRKKSNNHDAKSTEKSSKKSVKDKPEEKTKEKEKDKKEPEKKDKIESKETKDLKDIYKEKIRELREKKELTEKEKLSKDKDLKATKDTKEKRDSSRDKRDSKEHKSSSSKSSRGSDHKNPKSSIPNESKATKSESRDKGKRDERRYSKDHKSKSTSAPSDEKGDVKRFSRSDDKMEKSDIKDSKQKTIVKKDGKNGDKRDSKSEADKEKKRREEKKTKAKDDHSSLRKYSEDRRSTDRDGSNGSNGKSSQKSSSNSGASSTKPSASNLPKESTNTSNSSSETSDSIEESQNEKLRLSFEAKNVENSKNSREYETQPKKLDLGQNEVTLPIKKRPFGEGSATETGEVVIKKPKFAKNFQEAKRLMKIRRKMEKEKIKRQQEMEKNVKAPTTPEIKEIVEKNDLELVPDDERVQIIEVCDEEYDEPYPEIQSNFTLEERSQIILGGESIFMGDLPITEFKTKSSLSEMELSIRQSLNEMISDNNIEETQHTLKNKQSSAEESECRINESGDDPKETSCQLESSSNTEEIETKDSMIDLVAETPEIVDVPSRITIKTENKENIPDTSNATNLGMLTSPENSKNKEPVDGIETEENNEKVTFSETREYKRKVVEIETEENTGQIVEIETGENKGQVVEIETGENKGQVVEIETGENKGNVVEIETGQIKGKSVEMETEQHKRMVVEIESEENKETVDETENEENKEMVDETENEENKETVDETENEKNAEMMTKIEVKANKEKEAETEIEVNKVNIRETESEEKMTEPENNENIDTVVERKNEKNNQKVLDIKNYECEKIVGDSENRVNKENVTDIEKKTNQRMVTDMKNEENEEVVADIKNAENDEIAADFENEENEEIVAVIKNEENEEFVGDIINKRNEENVVGIKNEENEKMLFVTEICTKKNDIVRKPEDAQILESPDSTEAIESLVSNEKIMSIVSEEKTETWEAPVNEVQSAINVEDPKVLAKMEIKAKSCESITVKTFETCDKIKINREARAPVEDDLEYLSDEVPCLYFEPNSERLDKFTQFLKALEQEDESTCLSAEPAGDTMGSMGVDEAVSSLSKPMAPPKSKRKYSTSPLTDILLNNTNNNNDAHKISAVIADDEVEPNNLKKRKIGRPKKQRSSASLCGQQNLLNGENFVMPLSPESDVSATSEKMPSNPLKDEKSRPRGNSQRYTSDDLYKPRPLFASSSRRSRRSNQS